MFDRLVSILFILLSSWSWSLNAQTVGDREDVLPLSCHTDDASFVAKEFKKNRIKNQEILIVEVFYEVDHYTFSQFEGNVADVMDWANGLFQTVKDIYLIHNVELVLNDVVIEEVPGTYTNALNPSDMLDAFAVKYQDQDIAHVGQLLTVKNIGGGKAVLQGLCQVFDPNETSGPYSVAGNLSMDPSITNNYSWSTFLMAHELGHVLGSPHTHACLWGVNANVALDNCFSPEGGCDPGPPPSTAGTLMSYCYLSSTGIDFSLGLGAEPGELVYHSVANSCINSCAGEICDDLDPCTVNDIYDEDCNCSGILLDLNKNAVCDYYEPCDASIVINQIEEGEHFFLAEQNINTMAEIPAASSSVFIASDQIIFQPGFSISEGGLIEVQLSICGQD